MNARELIRNPVLSYNQTAFLLGKSTRTLLHWETNNHVPRAPSLVLRSIWSGLPVLAAQMWRGWRFDPTGALRTPGDYPLWPSDLWSLEFLYRNGLFSTAARGGWKQLEAQSNRTGPAWTPHDPSNSRAPDAAPGHLSKAPHQRIEAIR